ncbi:MAG: TonB-dependent receptor plug domain-containing protein, partial [Candidatus Eiseniibacteriota bacterium]
MPRRLALGALGLLLLITPTSKLEGAVPPPEAKPLPRATEHAIASGSLATSARVSGVPFAATSGANGSDEESPVSGRVIELPEEIVRAGGVSFDDRGGVKFAVPSSETQRLPGGFADPLRFMQMMPGVTNDSDFDGLLYVRGGDGGQNRILLDRVSVSDAYHFGGVVSVLNTDVIDRLEFMPGGYTAEYGDALSGVLSVKRRIGNVSDVRGTASLSVLTANGTAEGPLGNDAKGSWLVAARRSFIDQVLEGRTAGPTALPSYWDMDARLFRRFGTHDVRVGFLRSGDRLSARLSDTFTFTPAESSGLTWDRTMTLASLNWEHPGEIWNLSQAIAYSWRDQSVDLLGGLPQHASADTRAFDWRFDGKRPAGRVVWGTGAQLTHTHTIYDLDINRLSVLEPDRRSNPRSPLDTARVVTSYEGRNVYLAGYGQADVALADSAVTVTAGVR